MIPLERPHNHASNHSVPRRFTLQRSNGMRHRPGFTFLEIIISLTLMVSIFVITVTAVANALKENRARQTTIEATNRANQIVRSTASLIRQAATSPTGAYPIIAATSTSLTFYTTAADGTTIEQARLFLNGTRLQLGTIQPVGSPVTYPAGNEKISTLITGVQNGATALFQYYDKNYTGTQAAMSPITINSIRVVKVTVIFDTNSTAAPGPSTIELQAQLRNLKDNY